MFPIFHHQLALLMAKFHLDRIPLLCSTAVALVEVAVSAVLVAAVAVAAAVVHEVDNAVAHEVDNAVVEADHPMLH